VKRPTRSLRPDPIDLVLPTQEDFQLDLTERVRGAVQATIQTAEGVVAAESPARGVDAAGVVVDVRDHRAEQRVRARRWSRGAARQHFLYFLPLPQGQASLRPIWAMSWCSRDR